MEGQMAALMDVDRVISRAADQGDALTIVNIDRLFTEEWSEWQ
jgi:hypothetical protein